tara:strand:+ start:166 stop:999 length:834 start_codon:yes stop_codon:yes gene_type:complete
MSDPTAGGIMSFSTGINPTVQAGLEKSVPLTRAEEAVATPEQLVNANLRYAFSVAMKMSNVKLDPEEKVAAAQRALIKAAEKFDPKKGYKFITYSVWWIRRYIYEESHRRHIIRTPSNFSVEINQLEEAKRNGQEDLIDEKRKEYLEEITKLTQSAHLDKTIVTGNDVVGTLYDLIPDTRPLQDEAVEEDQRNSMLNELMDRVLTVQQKDVLVRYFGMGHVPHTLEEIALDYKLTRERIRQIKVIALKKLRHPTRQTPLDKEGMRSVRLAESLQGMI